MTPAHGFGMASEHLEKVQSGHIALGRIEGGHVGYRRRFGVIAGAIAGAGLGLSSFVLPADATGSPTVSGSIVLASGGGGSPCVFTVGYQWSGITPHSVELDVDAPNFTAGTLVVNGVKGRSGSVSGNITISDSNLVTYHGFGQILDRNGSPVSGTQVSSQLASSNQLMC